MVEWYILFYDISRNAHHYHIRLDENPCMCEDCISNHNGILLTRDW